MFTPAIYYESVINRLSWKFIMVCGIDFGSVTK